MLYEGSELSNIPILLVRDSDFDKFLDKLPISDALVCTDGYSVENYVCTEQAITNFLRDVLALDPSEVDVDGTVTRFSTGVRMVFTWISELYGACLVHSSVDGQLQLDALDFRTYFHQAWKGELAGDVPPEAFQTAGLKPQDRTAESRALGEVYALQDPLKWMRGKHLLACVVECLRLTGEGWIRDHRAGRISRLNRRALREFSEGSVFERLCGLTTEPAHVVEAARNRMTVAT